MSATYIVVRDVHRHLHHGMRRGHACQAAVMARARHVERDEFRRGPPVRVGRRDIGHTFFVSPLHLYTAGPSGHTETYLPTGTGTGTSTGTGTGR